MVGFSMTTASEFTLCVSLEAALATSARIGFTVIAAAFGCPLVRGAEPAGDPRGDSEAKATAFLPATNIATNDDRHTSLYTGITVEQAY